MHIMMVHIQQEPASCAKCLSCPHMISRLQLLDWILLNKHDRGEAEGIYVKDLLLPFTEAAADIWILGTFKACHHDRNIMLSNCWNRLISSLNWVFDHSQQTLEP